MSKKRQPFIIDENLGDAIKPYLPADSRTTTECGLRKGTKDYPYVVDLCQREEAMLVTADMGFTQHVKRHQREHNDCCWGLLILPDNEGKQIDVLRRLKQGKIKLKHPKGHEFKFDFCSSSESMREPAPRAASSERTLRLREGRRKVGQIRLPNPKSILPAGSE